MNDCRQFEWSDPTLSYNNISFLIWPRLPKTGGMQVIALVKRMAPNRNNRMIEFGPGLSQKDRKALHPRETYSDELPTEKMRNRLN